MVRLRGFAPGHALPPLRQAHVSLNIGFSTFAENHCYSERTPASSTDRTALTHQANSKQFKPACGDRRGNPKVALLNCPPSPPDHAILVRRGLLNPQLYGRRFFHEQHSAE